MSEHKRPELEWDIDLKRHNLTFLIVLLVLLVLFMPYLVRFYEGNTAVIGSESYLSMRYAEELADFRELDASEMLEKYSATPDLVYSRRTFHFNPYHVVLSVLGIVFGLESMARILPIVFGLLSILIFAGVLCRLRFDRSRRDVTLLFLATSPAFIYAFTFSTSHSLAILLSLLAVYLFMLRSRVWLAASVACMFVVSLFSIFNLLLVFLVVLALALKEDGKRGWFFVALFASMIFLFIKRVNLYYSYTTHESLNFFSSLFSDLGGLIGFGFISLFLIFLGWGSLWKRRGQLLIFVIPLLLLLSYRYVGEGVFMYLAFFVAIAAGEGFIRLIEMEWSLPLLKILTVIIIVCGVLFSAVSYTDRLIGSEPGIDTLHSLDLLKKSSKAGELVLTHPKYGYWVESVADRKVLADSLSTDNYDQKFLYKVADSVFQSRDLEETSALLTKYKIRYIWITPEMKSGLVWDKEDEGLLFLLEKSETFKKVYSTYGYDIWEVMRPVRDAEPVKRV